MMFWTNNKYLILPFYLCLLLCTACHDDNADATDSSGTKGEDGAKAAFSLIIANPLATSTRMGDSYTQQGGIALSGLSDIHLIAVKGSSTLPTQLAQAGDVFLSHINLGHTTAVVGVNYYHGVAFPIEDYRSVRYLFYGVASNNLPATANYRVTGHLEFPDYTTLASQGKAVNSSDALISLTSISQNYGTGGIADLQTRLKVVADSVDRAILQVSDSFAHVNEVIVDSLKRQGNDYLLMMNIYQSRDSLRALQATYDAVLSSRVLSSAVSADSTLLVAHLNALNNVISGASSFYVYDASKTYKYNNSSTLSTPYFQPSDIAYVRACNNTAGSVYYGTFTTFLNALSRYLSFMGRYTNPTNHTVNSIFHTYAALANNTTYDSDTRFVGKNYQQLELLMNYFTESAAEQDQETAKTFCESLISEYYKITDNSVYASNYGVEVFLASVYKWIMNLASPSYGGHYINSIQKVTTALDAMGTKGTGKNVNSGRTDYFYKLDPLFDDFTRDNPLGSYSISFTHGSAVPNQLDIVKWYTLNPVIAFLPNSNFSSSLYCYPPSLAYMGNGYLTPADKPVEQLTNSDWTGYTGQVYKAGSNGIANPAATVNLALSHTIRYGVGMLKLNLKRAAAGIKFSTVTAATLTDVDGRYDYGTLGKVTTDSIYLTGILIGGQPKRVGFDFTPSGSDKVAIYDPCFPNVSGELSSITVGSYIAGTGYRKTYNNVLPITAAGSDLYTLVLPSAVDGYPQGMKDSIYVAFELVNGCSKFLIGANNQLIYPGSVFYMVGVIDRTTATPTYIYNRIFNSNVTTSVGVTLDDFSYTGNEATWKKNLYTTVPNMQKNEVDFTLYITEGWIDGIYGNQVIGQ